MLDFEITFQVLEVHQAPRTQSYLSNVHDLMPFAGLLP